MKNLFRCFLLCVVCLIGGSQAQTYVGLGASLSVTDLDTNCPSCESYDTHKLSIKPTGFVGYRLHNTAIEAGIGQAEYKGHAVVPSRPADVRQQIDSRFGYVSGLQFFPLPTGEAFLGAGVARVWARNHEHGLTQDMQGNTGQVENKTYTKEIAPFIQAGYQYGPARVGVSFIPNVVRSVWTGQQDIWNVNASYVWRF